MSNTFNSYDSAALNVSLGGVASSGGIIEKANVSYGGKVCDLNSCLRRLRSGLRDVGDSIPIRK